MTAGVWLRSAARVQRGEAVPGARVGVRAGVEECRDDRRCLAAVPPRAAGCRSTSVRALGSAPALRSAVMISGVWLNAAACSGVRPYLGARVEVRAGVDEGRDDRRCLAEFRRPVQRCAAELIARVGVRAGVDECRRDDRDRCLAECRQVQRCEAVR